MSRARPVHRSGSAPDNELGQLLSVAFGAQCTNAARSRAQRDVARLLLATPEIIDRPEHHRIASVLRTWLSFAPYLCDEAVEVALGELAPALSHKWLAVLDALDVTDGCLLETAETALDILTIDGHPDRRGAQQRLDVTLANRAPLVASILDGLTTAHVADDRLRNLTPWRTRVALIEGTTAGRVTELLDVCASSTAAPQWYSALSVHIGSSFADRHTDRHHGLATWSIDTAANYCAEVLAQAFPKYRKQLRTVARRVTWGPESVCGIGPDGSLYVRVRYSPGVRGVLTVAHELGHGLHATVAADREPPGVFLGETVACLAAQIVGSRLIADAGAYVAAAAAGVGTVMTEEVYVSAAVSRFEDDCHSRVASGHALDAEWMSATYLAHNVFGPDLTPPAQYGLNWARLSSLAKRPGYAMSYTWANVMAAAVLAASDGGPLRHVEQLLTHGNVPADRVSELLALDAHWPTIGEQACHDNLRSWARLVTSGPHQ